jgi:hypothetical protein
MLTYRVHITGSSFDAEQGGTLTDEPRESPRPGSSGRSPLPFISEKKTRKRLRGFFKNGTKKEAQRFSGKKINDGTHAAVVSSYTWCLFYSTRTTQIKEHHQLSKHSRAGIGLREKMPPSSKKPKLH